MSFLLTKNRFCFLGLFLASSVAWSQSIERELTSSASDSFTNGGNTFEITIGDVAVSDLGSNPAFNQGFLQNANTIYIYSSGSWSPTDPVGNATDKDFVIVEDGSTTLTGNLVAQDLTVDSGATLDFGTNEVSLSERLTNNGTILGNDGTINFTGSTGVIAGNAFSISNFNGNGSGTLSIDTDISVFDIVTINSGILDNNSGKLIFKSDAAKTAMLDQVSGSITGNVQVERYYQDTRAFRFASSSVTTTSTIRDNWQEGVNNTSVDYAQNQNPNPGYGTHITGSTIGANGLDATQLGNYSLFEFDNVSQVWSEIANTDTQTISTGTPYRLFIRGDRSVNMNFSGDGAPATETVIRTEGALVTGTFSDPNLNTNAGAFNFIGNPYQASVNMNLVLGSSTNLNTNSFYVWDPNLQSGLGAYVTVALPAGTNTSSSSANQYLQPFQGAFVTTLSAGAASITFDESDKAVGENTSVYNTPNQMNSVIGQIYINNNGTLGQYPEDSYGIDFHETYSNDVNAMDAIKPLNIRENIYVNNSDSFLSLERRNLPNDNEEIHVDHTGYSVSNYTYRVYVTGLDAHDVFLKDDFTNQLTPLTAGLNEYDFSVDPNDGSGAIDRFSYVFQDVTLSNPNIDVEGLRITIYPNPISGDVLNINIDNVKFSAQNKLTYKLSTILGQQVMSNDLNPSNGQAIIKGLESLSSGTYLIEIFDGSDRLYTDKIVKE